MKKIFNILTLLLIVVIGLPGLAVSSKKSLDNKISSSVEEFLAEHPNLHATYELVNESKKVIAKGANGYAFIEKSIKLKPNQTMAVASATKNIIAAAILKLEEKKLLNVSDTIDKFFPASSQVWKADDKTPSLFPKWAKTVTIHHLLTHTSGLKEYVFNIKIDPSHSHEIINRQILNFAAKNGLAFTPGAKSKYSNTGYVILGMIIEHLTQTNLAQHLDEVFFKPLNMKDTHMSSLQEALDYRKGLLSGYPELYFAHWAKEHFHMKKAETGFFFVPYADGGIISTAHDISNWHYNLHHGKILSAKSYQKMIHPHARYPILDAPNRYCGYGIFIKKINDKDTLYYHAGRAAGIRSESGYLKGPNISFSIISNVMIPLNERQIKQIDLTNLENQVDIIFFLKNIINATQPTKVN